MRFARHGTYTGRDDIPHYEKVENQIAQPTNLLPSVVDQQERDTDENKSLPKAEIESQALPSVVNEKTTSRTVLTEEEVGRIRMEESLVEQIIQDFFDQFDEGKVKETQMQAWASQQTAASRPTLLRTVIENLN
jgi:hypothetical protein